MLYRCTALQGVQDKESGVYRVRYSKAELQRCEEMCEYPRREGTSSLGSQGLRFNVNRLFIRSVLTPPQMGVHMC